MRFHIVCGMLCLLLLCSCATENPKHFQLPGDVTMNRGAGRGDWLFVTLHMEDGEPLLCVLDTGTFGVILDKSLEPGLGRCFWVHNIPPHYGVRELRLHRAPKLYLGETPLQTGGWVWTTDLSGVSRAVEQLTRTNRPVMGVLGMSCLKHYCIQLDFTANKLRFLNDQGAEKQTWGKAFHLKEYANVRVIDENPVGVNGAGSIIDTGCNSDCYLTRKLYKQWTNEMETVPSGEARHPNAVLGGEYYTNVLASEDSGLSGIGLALLSRNLVTFDFPNHTMYLKKISTGPLIDDDTRSAIEFVRDLKKKNELPGWSNDEKAQIYFNYYPYPTSDVLDVGKSGDPTTYHYAVIRNPVDGSWELERAWQTNADGKIIKEYSVN